MNEYSLNKLTKYLSVTFLAVIMLYMAYMLIEVVAIAVASILLYFIFDPFVRAFEKQGFSRLISIIFIFTVFAFLVYLGLSYIIPNFTLQMNQLIETLNVYSIHDQLLKMEHAIYRFLPIFNPGELAGKIEQTITSQILNLFNTAALLLSGIFSIAVLIVIIPFLTFFLLKDSRYLFKKCIVVIPNKYFEMSYYISKKISVQLGKYVRAWIFDAAFVGVSFGLGLYIIGVGNSFPLGVIAGLGHLVPYFGPVIGGIPAIIISIIQYGDLSQVPYILFLMATIYTLDNGIVQPYVFSKSLDMHPIVIILLLLTGGTLFGIVGLLLIIPAATVLRTLVKEIFFAFRNYKIARL